MNHKMNEYALSQGMQNKSAGEIILTAAAGGEFSSVTSTELLEAAGILSSDSKVSAIEKIREAEFVLEKERLELESVLEWMGVEKERTSEEVLGAGGRRLRIHHRGRELAANVRGCRTNHLFETHVTALEDRITGENVELTPQIEADFQREYIWGDRGMIMED